jgi:hypothetical protein
MQDTMDEMEQETGQQLTDLSKQLKQASLMQSKFEQMVKDK